MSANSSIEWTDATWNPVRGCAIVSKGCTNCYAMRKAHRQSGQGGAYEGLTQLSKGGPVWTGKVRLVPELLDAPLRWRKPRRIFVNSMSDLFHEDVPDEFIDRIWDVMSCAPRHTFQILTKRPGRMLDLVRVLAKRHSPPDGSRWPLPNVWLGISAEDQVSFDERWQYFCGPEFHGWPLWLSAEPLLAPIDARAAMPNKLWQGLESWRGGELKWLVAGGESGPGARPSHPDWFRSLRDQCAAAGVPYFFKQHGNWRIDLELILEKNLWDETRIRSSNARYLDGYPSLFVNVGKKAAGRLLDGRTHDEFPG